jgi:hypothetical protein
MQQMISTLEQQNLTLRDRLKNVANGVANLIPGPTQAQALSMGGVDGANGDGSKRVVSGASQLPAATLTFQTQSQAQAQFQPQLLQQIHPQLLSLFPMGVNTAGFPQSIFFGGLPVNMSVGANGVPQQMVTIALPVPLSAASLSGLQQHEALFQAIPAAMLSEGGLVTLAAPLTAASSASDLPSQVSRASSPTSTAEVPSTDVAAASSVTDAVEKVVSTVEPITEPEMKLEKPVEKTVTPDLPKSDSAALQPL